VAVLYFIYNSMSKGPTSLIGALQARGISDWRRYISFGSARTHQAMESDGRLVTECVYIHSKLVLVDDEWSMIGSANINDRSLLGTRDSEVCLLIKDKEFLPSTMNGQPCLVGRYAHSIRSALMCEYLGQSTSSQEENDANWVDVSDPTVDSFFIETWGRIAKSNTTIYEEVFHCFPSDRVASFVELQNWKNETPKNPEDRGRLAKLSGTLVEFSVDFLRDEDLSPSISTKEGLVPTKMFT